MAGVVLFFVSYTVHVPHAPPVGLARLDTMTPAAPPFSSRTPRFPVGFPALTGYPVFRMRVVQSLRSLTIVVSILAFDFVLSCAAHSSSDRQVAYIADRRTAY